jgi:long-subunit acyl-CoA synthetase (AMP-forming)
VTALGDNRRATEAALAATTLCEAFQITASVAPDQTALENHGGTERVTWAEYARRVRTLARGLHACGIASGDTVALLLRNRPVFNIVDTAVLHLGAIPFSLYATEPVQQIAALIEDSGATVIVTESMFLDKIRAVAAACPQVGRVVIDGGQASQGEREITLDELQRQRSDDFDFDAVWRAVGPEAIGTLVYTSGTTGEPKGVQISHRSLMHSVRGVDGFVRTEPHRGVSFLPAAHITDRFICHASLIVLGGMVTCVPDHEDLWDAIRATRPTRFFGVPRTCEKLAEQAQALIEADSVLQDALAIGYERVRAEQGETPPLTPARARAAGDALQTLAPVREQLGLDQVQWFAVAAAPSAYETLEFHHALGLNLAELWGQTESMMSTMNPPARVKLGTVGVALPAVEVRIAGDGELLLRGGHTCSGYRNKPEQTAEMLDADGWVHSGDLASIDADGYIGIIGRKKEQMINSSGKNLSPVKIESTVLRASPLIGHIAIVADRRRWVTALVVLEPEQLAKFAVEHGLHGSRTELISAAPIVAEVDRAIAVANHQLARVEQIRGWTILDTAWEPGGEELTNTLKLRRGNIDEKYAAQIEAMYA